MDVLEHLAEIYSSEEFKEGRDRLMNLPLKSYQEALQNIPLPTLISQMIEIRFYFPEMNLDGQNVPQSVRDKYYFIAETIALRECNSFKIVR